MLISGVIGYRIGREEVLAGPPVGTSGGSPDRVAGDLPEAVPGDLPDDGTADPA